MTFGRNSNGQGRPQGKVDDPNKVRFSSVKMGETKQGSPTLGLYLKRDQAEKLATLLGEMLNAGEDGCKFSCIVIPGKDWDSGYMYVNPKEQRHQGDGNNAGYNKGQGGFQQGNNGSTGGGYRKPNGFAGGKSSAREFLQAKRINDGEEEDKGN
jgi:hypothetical protein